ncbi:MAG TPA: histidine kinase dimerization/phosphoacceptor domain -containing protein [Aestuariivirgaceae bacterium]|nr:histidine kinase dimerization/phosphoacceptor domain -containing protein [Aestuariivirgaceae bacterium]
MPARTWRSPLRLLQIGSLALPAAIIGIWGVVSWNTQQREAFEQAHGNAELLREYSLRVLETQRNLLYEAEYLIEDVDVAAIGERALHERLQPLTGRLRLTLGVGVISADGEILGSTSFPVSGRAEHRTYFQTLSDASAEPDEMFVERVRLAQQEALLVAKRRPGDSFNGVLVAAVDLDAMTEFFARVVDNSDASASLIAANGSKLLRYPAAPPTTLAPDAPLMRAAAQSPAGVYEAPPTFDDVPRVYGFSQLGEFPAFAVFGLSRQGIVRSWQEKFLIIAALVSLAALMAFAASTQAIRRVNSEDRQRRMAFDRRLLEEAQKSAEGRGQLLREAHHRTKNNLQMVLAMIRAKASELGDAPGLRDIEKRLLALAQVHDLLYNSNDDSSLIDLGEFLQAICTNPSIVPPESGIEVACDVEPLDMDVAEAVPVALIAVEILTNSLKHGFPDGRVGRIEISLQCLDDRVLVSIGDNGVGLPPVSGRQRTSGLRLIEGLARQLRGRLEISTDGGTRFDLYLPLPGGGELPAAPAASPTAVAAE